MLPIAGAVIGAIAAFVLWIAAKLGLPPSLAALSAVSSLVLLTGALHEDGMADFADATAGTTPEQRLAIMKDSRIGTFGTLALILGSLARVLSIAVIAAHSLCLAGWVLIATAAVSRTLMLFALYLLPPARTEGAGFSAAAPSEPVLAIAALIGFILALLPLLAHAGFGRVAFALILSVAFAYGVIAVGSPALPRSDRGRCRHHAASGGDCSLCRLCCGPIGTEGLAARALPLFEHALLKQSVKFAGIYHKVRTRIWVRVGCFAVKGKISAGFQIRPNPRRNRHS